MAAPRWWIASLVLVTVLSRQVPAYAALFPVSFSEFKTTSGALGGELIYDARSRSGDNDEQVRDRLELDGRLRLGGFYWRPWLATWAANLNARLANLDPFFGDESRSDLSNWSGSFAMDMFPLSRFPIGVSLSHSQVYNDLLPVIGDRESASTRLAIDGAYTYLPGITFRGVYDLGYVESDTRQFDTLTHTLRLGGTNSRLNRQSVSGNLLFRHRDIQGAPDQDFTLAADVAHRYQPTARIKIDSGMNYTHSSDTNKFGEERTVDIANLSSIGFWQHNFKPLTANGQARATWIEDDPFSGSPNSTTVGLLSASAFYNYSPSTSFSASTTNVVTKSTFQDDYFLGQNLAADYRSPSRYFREVRHSWTARGSFNNRFEDGVDDYTQVDADLSQGINWNGPIGPFALSLRHSDGLASGWDTVNDFGSRLRLDTGAVFSWIKPLPGRSIVVSFTADDDRSIVITGETQSGDVSRQNLVLDVSDVWNLRNRATLTTSLNSEAIWSDNDGKSRHTKISRFSSRYDQSVFLNVPRLRFSSHLAASTSNGLLVYSSNGIVSWFNTLSYFIGRVELTFEADWVRQNESDNIDLHFRAVRHFGR